MVGSSCRRSDQLKFTTIVYIVVLQRHIMSKQEERLRALYPLNDWKCALLIGGATYILTLGQTFILTFGVTRIAVGRTRHVFTLILTIG